MTPALAYFSIRSGRMPSEANMTTFSTGRPSSFFAPAEPVPIVITSASIAAAHSPGARKRRRRFKMILPLHSPK